LIQYEKKAKKKIKKDRLRLQNVHPVASRRCFQKNHPKELLFFIDQQKKICKPGQGFWLLFIPLSIKAGGDCLLLAFYEGIVDHRKAKKVSLLSSFCFSALLS